MKYESKSEYHKKMSLYILIPISLVVALALLDLNAGLIYLVAPLIVYALIYNDKSFSVNNKIKDAISICISSWFFPAMFAWHFLKHIENKY